MPVSALLRSSKASSRSLPAIVCVFLLCLVASFSLGCGSSVAPAISTENESATPAADPIGERLFLDTRFAKFFFVQMTS